MTILISWVAYSTIALLTDQYLSQNPAYARDGALPRAAVAYLWPMAIVVLAVCPKDREEIAAALEAKRAAADQQLDRDIAEVLQLIEYEKYRSDPWRTLDPHPRGTEPCQ